MYKNTKQVDLQRLIDFLLSLEINYVGTTIVWDLDRSIKRIYISKK